MRVILSLTLVLLLFSISVPDAQAADRYWQQHVRYDIAASLLDSIHTLDGNLSVVYTNNSPDTLQEVFFHLYSNAFHPNSLMDERATEIKSRPVLDRISKLPESEWGKYTINTVRVNDATTQFQITGTIMRVGLHTPLLPGDSVTIAFPFREQVPRQIRRSGWRSRENVQYSMSQWYPKVAEYDQEGWQIQEYVLREFYGVWGEFNVTLDLPASYTVGATGQCMNPLEVRRGYDEIASGKKDGVYLPDEDLTGRTIWKFRAENVHDFAWVADDQYVHQWTTWQDTVTLHSLVKQQAFGLWHDALKFAAHSLATYSELYGPYAYRNFSVTMAGDGGMEYPQLIMITGYRGEQSLAGVTAHETAHQWFYGMLGSNESREAFMDEGFTSFATTIAMTRLYGENQELPNSRTWLDWFLPQFRNKSDNYRGYQSLAVQGYEEPLDIPHDWFREDVSGGQVYGKTQAILSMLQYTLGDSIFDRGMKAYFTRWRFKHPHLSDFQKVMEETAHTDLDWFFDEWFKTTRTVDYAAKDVESEPAGSGYRTTVRLENKDLGVMPLDLLLHYRDGSTELATIPLATHKNEAYHKSGVELFFPSWDWPAVRYEGTALTPKPVSWFEIDTSWRLQDLNWLNNYSDRSAIWWPRGYWAVWKQLFLSPPLDGYYSVLRPIAWYESLSKLELGLGSRFGMNNGFNGDIEFIWKTSPTRIINDEVTAPLWYDHIDGALTYSQPVNWLGRLSNIKLNANKLDGITTLRATLTKTIRPEYLYLGATHTASLYIEQQQRLNEAYPFYHHGWSKEPTKVAGFDYVMSSEDAKKRFELNGETSILNSDNSFERVQAKLESYFNLLTLPNRVRFAIGSSTLGAPYQRRFWLDRANNYDEQSDILLRVLSGLNNSVGEQGALFAEGGAGVRGYNGSEHGSDDGSLSGNQMLGVNYDLSLPNPLVSLGRLPASFGFGAFADAGWVGNSGFNFEDVKTNLRTDAGVKIGVNVLSWLPSQLQGVAQEYAPIPVINVYLPLYENHPVDGKRPIAFRWAVSIGAGF